MTQPTDTVSALKTIPLLAGLPHSDLEELAKKVTEASYAVGTELIKEGTSGSSVFLIVDGECEVRRLNVRIRTLGPGEFFGELSILDPAPRTASVRVTEAARVLILEGKDFRNALKSNMQMAQKLIIALAERLRRMTDEFAPRAKG
jgi:CRP-like cAMP-binding protein